MHPLQWNHSPVFVVLMWGDYLPVLRQHHTRDFTTLPNALLLDQRLSCRDRGLLVWMLSKPPDWHFSKRGMQAELPLDGEHSIQAGVKKLQETGYLMITQEKTRGKFGKAIWIVTDSPQLEKPATEKPATENHAHTKDIYNKKKKAAPDLRVGEQPSSDVYFDPNLNRFVRRQGT